MEFDWKDFDAQMRGWAETEDCPVPVGFEERLERRLEQLPVQSVRKGRLGRRIVAVLAAVLILTGSAVAISPALREQLGQKLGLFESYTTPIEGVSAVDQGIEVRLLSAMADEYTARIYLEVRDLTGKRPMENLECLWPDFLAPKEGAGVRMMTFGTRLLGYEEETKTALVELSTAGEDYMGVKEWNLRIDRITFLDTEDQDDIQGSWELPFELTTLETRSVSLDRGDHSDFHTLKISPIGIVLEGGLESVLQIDDAEVTFADGKTIMVESGGGSGGTEQMTSSWCFDEPVSTEEIVRFELPSWNIVLDDSQQGTVTRK